MIYPRIVAALLVVTGAVLGVGGIWLAVAGGSWFYILLGAAVVTSGVLAWRGEALSLWVYAATLVVTLAWAVWEVGFDWWQLAPRGDVLVILGLLLVLPWAVRPMGGMARRPAQIALGLSLALSVIVGGVALAVPSNDLSGTLDTQVAAQKATSPAGGVPAGEWQAYGRTSYGQRYSPLDQITPKNASSLQVAWTYHTGDVRSDSDPVETTYEVTPLMVNQTVYLCTPHDLVIALDAETGAEKWRFDPKLKEPPKISTQHLTCRGVSYDPGTAEVSGAAAPATADCAQRLFLPTADGRLIAISSTTGKVCPGFGGPDGTVDLWQHMPNVTPGSYYSTSPPVITDRLIIVGGAVNDNVSVNETSGVIRAFDKQTGDLVWNWDSLKPDQTAPITGDATYSVNSPNSWSVASYDPALRLIYLPMGNQPPDQYGANRSEDAETYSSSIVALNADTGEVAWVFQGAHHDLWDMDVPAQPSLIDLTVAGATVPALVAPTKQGEIFVLDRRTGEPVLPVTETPAPQGAAPGDHTAATQPVSALSFKPDRLTGAAMWGVTPFDELWCRIRFHQLDYDGRYTPPSTNGTIVYPGNFGSFNWGAVAVDPERQVMFGMPVYLAFTSTLVPRPNDEKRVVTGEGDPEFNENFGAPYAADMKPFLSPLGLPCQAPPWGYVAGADLTTGKIVYKHVNGTIRDLSPIPLPFKMGVPGIGGPILTKGGVAFLSGSLDYYVRAYDVETGQVLWQSRLPAGGQATPMTYWSDESQRQFVVVVAGGHGSTGTEAGDSIIAYALPKAA